MSEFYISLQAFYICYFVFCLKRSPKTVSASDPPKSGYTFGPNPLGRQTHTCELTEVHSIVVSGEKEDTEVSIWALGGMVDRVGSK